MPTKPKHYAVFILNENGSGTVKQFDTWQEAKAAYAAESMVNKAVYLYPQPMKAIGAGTTPIEAPAKAPVAFTPQQNTGQFAWPPSPPLPRPPVREPGSGGPFGPPSNYDAWMTYCTAHPTHRECTIPGKEKFGTVLSTICSVVEGATSTDDTGQPWPASIPQQIKADGLGGTFEAGPPAGAEYFDSPCQLPNGFQQYGDTIFVAPEIVIFTLKSTATAGPAFLGRAVVERQRELKMWNGAGSSEVVRTEHGFLDTTAAAYPFVELKPAEAGDSIYELDGTLIGTINVTYPLMPSSDNHIEEVGTETEDVMVNITQRGTTVKSGTRSADKFENKWPAMDPDSVVSNIGYDPDAGVGTGSWSITNNGTGAFDGVNFEWIPGTPADGRPPAGWAGYVKRDASGDFDRVDPPVPTPEGQTWLGEWVYAYYPDGTILDEDDDNYYKANGTGGYYVEAKDDNPPGCDAAGELSRGPTQDYMYETPCGSYQLGYYNVVLYADGNCFTYEANDYDITSVGDFTTCEGEIYSVDAEGVVTTRPECEDASLYAGQDGWTYDGCNWTYDDGCDASGTNLGVDPNDSCNDVFADGMCGTYTESNGSCDDPDCEDSGLHENGVEGWSYDGCNWSYDDRWNCEDSSAHTDGSEGWSYDGCNWSYNPYWDCTPSGTSLGQDPNDSCYDLYADGYCGQYSSSNGSCDGPNCEDSSAHTQGEEGWSYDGCYWTQDPNWNCEDSTLHSGESGWSYDGCNWSYCDPSGTDLGQDPSDSCNNIYADGNCGTYTSSNGSCPNCPGAGDFNYSDGCNNYYHDGNCGEYAEPNGSCCDPSGTNLGVSADPCYDVYADGSCGTYTSDNGSCGGGGGGDGDGGPGCDSAGNMVSSNLTADLYITTPCGEAVGGTRTYDVYTDGNCGTTEQTTNEAWSSNGTELNSCSDGVENCTYYADGNGSYTSNCSPIDPPPPECESDSLHVEGEDGWTYDGCHWQQTECNGDPSTDVPDSESTGEEQGVGAGEAQLYDNDGNPVQYESYDPSTGEASFGAGNNPYQNGDWLRNSYGNIIYSSRSPRMATASIAPNYSNNLSCINNGTRTPSGKQSIQIQVGWRYTGRKRWRSDFNQFQNETVFANSADQPVSAKVAELAIIPAGTWVGIIPQAGAGPHTFYSFNGSATMPNGATGQKAYSDGVGGAYYGT